MPTQPLSDTVADMPHGNGRSSSSTGRSGGPPATEPHIGDVDVAETAAQTQLDANRYRALHELAVAAAGQLDPVKLSEQAAEKACQILGVDSARFYWWDAGLAGLRPLAPDGEFVGTEGSIASGHGLVVKRTSSSDR